LAVFPEIVSALDSLDDHLAYRTYLVGHDVTAADWAVWGALKGALALTDHSILYNEPNLTFLSDRQPQSPWTAQK
jgi:glutathione S-transferase